MYLDVMPIVTSAIPPFTTVSIINNASEVVRLFPISNSYTYIIRLAYLPALGTFARMKYLEFKPVVKGVM